MSFSETHPRDARGRFATGGVISGAAPIIGEAFNVGVSGSAVNVLWRPAATPAPKLRRHPVRWWYRRKARRRIAAVRARQRTYSGTFKVAPDQVYSRLVYQWLEREWLHVRARRAPWSARAVARAVAWAIVLRMVRGG